MEMFDYYYYRCRMSIDREKLICNCMNVTDSLVRQVSQHFALSSLLLFCTCFSNVSRLHLARVYRVFVPNWRHSAHLHFNKLEIWILFMSIKAALQDWDRVCAVGKHVLHFLQLWTKKYEIASFIRNRNQLHLPVSEIILILKCEFK